MPRAKGSKAGSSSARSRNKRKNSKMMMPRKCSSCGVTRTPQWREGPVGPKTLCNACGVKYSREKGGRRKPARKQTTLRPRTQISTQKTQGRSTTVQEQSTLPPKKESNPSEDLTENKGHASLVVVVPHTLQGMPSLSPSETETLFDKDDYQAAETILRISRSESPAAESYGKQPWSNTFSPGLPQATGVRRSLRVQLKREKQVFCAGCHGCDQSPSFRLQQKFPTPQEKKTAASTLPSKKRKLKDFDLSLIVGENNGDMTETLNFVQCELQCAEERASAAEKEFNAAKESVAKLRSQLGEIINSLDKVQRVSNSPDVENSKRRCL